MKYIELINKMTTEEKASLMSGQNFWNTKSIDRLGIPSIMMTDGPHGLRKQGGHADHLGLHKSLPATCFPTAATLANSWDRSLLQEVGDSLGKEAASENVSVLLGPGLNIKRNPLCGRNFEYFSEDPFLSGELASEMVNGIQSNGVAACPKHFAVNSQEHLRMTIDEVVDERSLREIYLEAFRRVIKKSNPKTIMSSYNKINGTYANEHMYIMKDILYNEWGFNGIMITDWGGNNDRVEGLKAGNQLEMPSTNGITDLEIVDAISQGTLDEEVLDQAVDQMLQLVFDTESSGSPSISYERDVHHEKAVHAAKQSIVLLKNNGHTLPIQPKESVAIIGDFAKNPRYQGAGSSLINPTKVTNAVDELTNSSLSIIGYAKGFKRMGGTSRKLAGEAIQLAKKADTVLLFLGLDEGSEAEGIDREHLKLRQNQLDLLNKLTKESCKVVVILSGGGAIEMPFVEQVDSIVHTYLSGQGSAEALTSILLGETNPSGKLSETFPLSYEDVPSAPYYPGREATSEHREGLFIGYRYFNTFKKDVLFPFGYGLSYTTFSYSNLEMNGHSVTFNITNTGEVAGAEVVQLYIGKEQPQVFRSKRELKGFEKVHLLPGETKTLTIYLEEQDFSYYHPKEERWVVEPGEYKIEIGRSIEQIELTEVLQLRGEQASKIHSKEEFPHYFAGEIKQIPDHEFKLLLGFEPPPARWDRIKDLGLNDTIAQAQYKNFLGRSLYRFILLFNTFFNKINKPLTANNVYFVLNMPFRQMERFTGGKVSKKKTLTLLRLINK